MATELSAKELAKKVREAPVGTVEWRSCLTHNWYEMPLRIQKIAGDAELADHPFRQGAQAPIAEPRPPRRADGQRVRVMIRQKRCYRCHLSRRLFVT